MDLAVDDHVHQFLIGNLLPLVATPPGLQTEALLKLRGVVRADDERCRIVMTNDNSMSTGVAMELALSELIRGGVIDGVDLAVAYAYTEFAMAYPELARDNSLQRDSHGNSIIAIPRDTLSAASSAMYPGQELYRLFRLLHGGPNFPSYEADYAFTGFMFMPENRCRVYAKAVHPKISYGLEFPLATGSRRIFGMSSSFPQELAMKLSNDGELFEPIIDEEDEYCDRVYDLTRWIDPPGSPVS